MNRMSVIHLNDRLTGSLEEFNRYKRSSESLIYFDSNLKESFSVDFTVGNRWAEYAGQVDSPQLYDIKDDKIEIHSKQSVIIETKEKIMMPHNLFGILMPTGRLLLDKGIMCNTTKIEPGYEDKLFLLLFNSSNSRKTINVNDKITTAIFINTEETPAFVDRIHRDMINQHKPFLWHERFMDSLKSNYNNNPYFFIFELFKLIITFVAGATFAFLLDKYFNS